MKKGKQVQGIVEAIKEEARTWAQAGNKGLQLLLEEVNSLQETVGSTQGLAQDMVVYQFDVN